jgi:CBS domain-containing protein
MRRLQHIHKVQELVYELKIRNAVEEEVCTISKDTMMSDVRAILREQKITAAPVIDNSKLIGIISVEDYINWLQEGGEDTEVSNRMSRDVITMYDDEPLIDAIRAFEEYRYYEFPVMERNTDRLIGVITKFDVIIGLLKALDIDYYQKEIEDFSNFHFFKEVVSEDTRLSFYYTVPNGKIELGGEVASKLRKNLSYLGIHPDIIVRAAIVTYEAEMNCIMYGGGGEMRAFLDKNKIVIEVSDEGPGIEDIEKVMLPGYSTAPDWIRELGFGAGMGLPNIEKNSEKLDIQSELGKGTKLTSTIPLELV